MEDSHNAVYTCPMHPEVQKALPGICPICGMNLILAKSDKSSFAKIDKSASTEASADKHAGHSIAMFRNKFWVSLLLTVPVVLYSGILKEIFGFSVPEFLGSAYVPLVFGSIVFFYGGLVFIRGALREIGARLPGMMTLIALAITTAYTWSIAVVFLGKGGELFWELTTLVTVMLLGHWMEMRAISGAQGALRELSKLLPDTAEVIRNGKTEVIPLSEVRAGDVVFVRPGGKIPTDGKVIEGRSEANEAMITGESRAVSKNMGSEVIAGTTNSGDGALTIEVTKIGENTFLAGVMRLVAEAQASKSKLQILSDRAAFYLTIIAIATGSATLVVWLALGGGVAFALERLVAVLVIACPHALGLAVPLVASISTTLAARSGLLVKQRLALEAARNINTVLFDKTGTLTRGEYGVTDIIANDELQMKNDEVLQLAASIDQNSEHAIARTIVKDAEKRGLKLEKVNDFKRIPGKGTTGRVREYAVFVGGEAILAEAKAAMPPVLKSEIENLAKQGKTIIYVIREKELVGIIAFADIIRDESRDATRALKAMAIKVAMITGDSEDVAKWVADELGIDEYFARVLPQEKAEKVKLLQGKGERVAMVGDGINDAPALTQADIGIAIGAGTNVAIESAGIILVKNDPRDIVKIITLSRATYAKMMQNLFWATGYNVIALPLAAGVLAAQGVLLQPALAALFMSLSTVIVALNALFLRRRVI